VDFRWVSRRLLAQDWFIASSKSKNINYGRRKTTMSEAWYGLGLGFGFVLGVRLGFGLA
ncbi:hypothetical protein DPMN_010916, partial [Dreissena polymorpha]